MATFVPRKSARLAAAACIGAAWAAESRPSSGSAAAVSSASPSRIEVEREYMNACTSCDSCGAVAYAEYTEFRKKTKKRIANCAG
jgi:hypothetical protein